MNPDKAKRYYPQAINKRGRFKRPLSGSVIRKILSEFPGAIISISHDRKFIGEVCTKTYTLTKDGLKCYILKNEGIA